MHGKKNLKNLTDEIEVWPQVSYKETNYNIPKSVLITKAKVDRRKKARGE